MLTLLFSPFRLVIQSTLLALSQIWANKIRSLLTTIGIVIAVASVSAVISALSGMQNFILNQFASFGANKIYVNPYWPPEYENKRRNWLDFRFTPTTFEGFLDHCPSIESFTLVSQSQVPIRFDSTSVDAVPLSAISSSWFKIESRDIDLGRPFSIIDDQQASQVCVIEPGLIDSLNLDRDPVGDPLHIQGRVYYIIGVVEPNTLSADFGGEGETNRVYVPHSTWYKHYGRNSWVSVIAAAKSTELAFDAQAEASFFLRRQRNIKPGEPDTFRTDVVAQFLDDFKQTSTVLIAVAAGVVGISLIVGGVGIMNIMLVSVSERTREIGLRKAVGARPGIVMLQFLVEAVVLCCFGGAVGLLGGQGLTMLLRLAPSGSEDPNAVNPLANASMPLWAIMLAFGFSAGVGLVFGFVPAVKASRLDPIDALRHE